MIFRKADSRDRPQILSIWGEIFNDGDAVINRILDEFSGFENVYVAEKDGIVISQLLAVPCVTRCSQISVDERGVNGVYLYALATIPEYRSGGVMADLMNHVEKDVRDSGGSFFILIPASASLFDYYEARDFDTVYTQNIKLSTTHGIEEVKLESDMSRYDFKNGKIPANLFINLRSKFMEGDLICFNEIQTEMELEELWYYGVCSVYCEEGYIIYQKIDETLFVLEGAFSSESFALDLISYAHELTGCSKVEMSLPMNSSLFIDKLYRTKQTPQAQYKWWGTGCPPEFYIRFALDDLPARIKENKEDIII